MNDVALDLANHSTLPTDRHPLGTYLASLGSSHSRDATRQAARKCLGALLGHDVTDEQAQAFPFHSIRYQHVAAIRSALADEGLAPSTISTHLALFKGILRECWRLGHLDSDAHARINDVSGVRGSRLPAGRALSAGELRELFAACTDASPSGMRDAALLSVLYGTGMRRGEVVALQTDDHDTDAASLKVAGKGNRERLAYLPAGAQQALQAWLGLRGHEPGPLFVAVTRGGQIGCRPLSTQAVAEALARRARRAGIDRVRPHDLRRTHIGDLLDLGADLSVVSRMVGHADVSTTGTYDRRPDAAKRRAASLLHVPIAGGA